MASGQLLVPLAKPTHLLLCCFRCNQPGHRVAKCLVPAPQTPANTPGKTAWVPQQAPEWSRAAHQVKVSVMAPEEGEAMTVGKYQLMPYDSEDDGLEDPMVSQPICPSSP